MFEKAKIIDYQSAMDVDFKTIHQNACLNEESGYMDPITGLFVLTSFYLQERGTCCGSGCRHCPYSPTEQQEAGRRDVPCFPFVKTESATNTKNDK